MKTFKSGRNPHKYNIELENNIIQLFNNGLSATKIAHKLNKHTTAIIRVLKRNNCKLKTGKGKDCYNWKGGRGLKSGYWCVYNPTHPRALNNKRVWEHILIMEKHIGRPVLKSEPIHHIDFNRMNNSLNNLYLCKNASEHSNIHGSLEKTVQELFRKKIIIFINGKYQINKKKVKVKNLPIQNQILNKWL